MPSINVLKSHNILDFPKPFSEEETPYKESDFADSVKNACSSLSASVCGLRMCKVIIIGDINVGKTSIVNRFTRQSFTYNYKATIGVDFEMVQFYILNVPFNMQIWDTAGQERFKCIASAYYRRAHVLVTVFDFTNMKSLYHSLEWFNEALKENTVTPLKFLVGTKLDLLKSRGYSNVEAEALKIAKSIGAEFWAVSSKTGQGIKELFYRMATLSFEKIVKLELEVSNDCNKYQLGEKLSCSLTKNDKQNKNKFNIKKKCFSV